LAVKLVSVQDVVDLCVHAFSLVNEIVSADLGPICPIDKCVGAVKHPEERAVALQPICRIVQICLFFAHAEAKFGIGILGLGSMLGIPSLAPHWQG
jgi:hypothetical protein